MPSTWAVSSGAKPRVLTSGPGPHNNVVNSALAVIPVTLLLILSVILQQITVPGTGVPVSLVLLWACALGLWVAGAVTLDIKRVRFASVLAVGIASSFLVWLILGVTEPSLFSLLYITACWLPFVFKPKWNTAATDYLLKHFLRIVGVLAVVSVAQFCVQLLGGPFIDWIATLPKELVIPGYVHRARLELPGFTGLIRSNGMVFLEPSIASQFYALAAIVALRRRPLLVPLFICALLFTGSGTGILALLAGILGFVLTGNARERVWSLLSCGVGVTVLVLTGLIDTLFRRSSEFNAEGTSATFRFIDPWEHLSRFAADYTSSLMFGLGPGGVSETARLYGPGVNYTFTPKLVIEYGLLFALITTAATAWLIFMSKDLTLATRFVLIAMTFFLSGALGQPASAVLLWCMCHVSATTSSTNTTQTSRRYCPSSPPSPSDLLSSRPHQRRELHPSLRLWRVPPRPAEV